MGLGSVFFSSFSVNYVSISTEQVTNGMSVSASLRRGGCFSLATAADFITLAPVTFCNLNFT